MTERATTDADDAGTPATLDWLPDRAVGIGRALVPVLAAFGRDEPAAELARLAGGFADDPPIVGVRAVAASFGLNTAVRECATERSGDDRHAVRRVSSATDRSASGRTDRPSAPDGSVVPDPGGHVRDLPSRPGVPPRRIGHRHGGGPGPPPAGREIGLVLAILAGVLLALPTVLVAGLAKAFVNKYLVDGSVQWLDAVLIAFLLAAVLQVGLSALQQSAMTRTSRKMSITMSADYLWHLFRLPISHFVARPAGDLGFLMDAQRPVGDIARAAAVDGADERRRRVDLPGCSSSGSAGCSP